jgi:hypothetical protein
MIPRQRFYTPSQFTEDRVLVKLLRQVILINSAAPISKIVFVGFSLGQTGLIEQLFNDDSVVKKMNKGGYQVPPLTINMEYTSKEKYRPSKGDVMVPIGLRSDEILKLEDYNECLAIIAIPYAEKEIEKWCKITQATEVETGNTQPPYSDIDCITKKAFGYMDSINMNSGTLEVGDQDRVVTYFKELLENGVSLSNDEEIENYLMNSLDWTKQNIETIFPIMQRLRDGGRVQYDRLGKPGDFFSKWEAACTD